MTRGIRYGSLGLVLILIVPAVRAQQDSWRAVPTGGAKGAERESAPGVSLDPPVRLLTPRTATSNSGIQAASFNDSSPRPTTVRGQSVDSAAPAPRKPSIWGEAVAPLPAGTVVSDSAPVGGRLIPSPAGSAIVPPPVPDAMPAASSLSTDCCEPGCDPCCGPFCRIRNWICSCFADAGCDDGCSAANRFYISAEYLNWATKRQHVPPLVTTGSASDTLPGAIGMPGTSVLFGGNSIGGDARSGGRFTLGYWCDDCHDFGIEGSYFFLSQATTRFSAASGGSPILARPFFNAATGMEDSELVAFPSVLAGSANVSLVTRLFGAEANLRTNLCRGCCYHSDLLFGFRIIGLDDSLEIGESLSTLAVPGGSIVVSDRFNTQNRIYSGQIGLDTEFRRGRWFLDLKGKVALGSNHESVNIAGNTIISDPRTGTSNFNGGLLALSSNSGRFSRDMFVVAPEGTINLGYQITDNLRVFAGYNFLYLSNVVRAGNQIDRVVNPNLIPSAGGPTASLPVRPAFSFKGTDFWAQGVNFGLEYRY